MEEVPKWTMNVKSTEPIEVPTYHIELSPDAERLRKEAVKEFVKKLMSILAGNVTYEKEWNIRQEILSAAGLTEEDLK